MGCFFLVHHEGFDERCVLESYRSCPFRLLSQSVRVHELCALREPEKPNRLWGSKQRLHGILCTFPVMSRAVVVRKRRMVDRRPEDLAERCRRGDGHVQAHVKLVVACSCGCRHEVDGLHACPDEVEEEACKVEQDKIRGMAAQVEPESIVLARST
jgi:hypothetical protein